jgi:hypothetical protein
MAANTHNAGRHRVYKVRILAFGEDSAVAALEIQHSSDSLKLRLLASR